jgi:sporulation-control protein spo0M
MLKKMFKKIRSKYFPQVRDFPREFKYYNTKFEANDWVVKKDSNFSAITLIVFFKGTKIAQTIQDVDYSMISKIVLESEFEDLKSEVSLVLLAASREKVIEEQEQIKVKKNLVKQAKSQTKFLGPFQ